MEQQAKSAIKSMVLKLRHTLEEEGEFLEKAALLVSGHPGLSNDIEKERKKWESAVEQLEPIQEWRGNLQEVKLQKLRELTAGKRALFVGGRNKGFDEEETRKEFSFEKVDFVPHFASERGSLDKVRDQITSGKLDYLFDFIRFGAHRNLDQECENFNIRYIRVRNSRSLTQITQALAKAHKIKLN